MATTLPPTITHKVAAPHAWEAATVQELWVLSDRLGVPACAIFAAPQKLVRGDAENVSDRN